MFSAALYARGRTFLCTFAHEIAGAARIRHSLRPLISEGGDFPANLGRSAPRECERVFGCRHCERSEAIHRATQRKNGLLRCFAPVRKRFAFVAGDDGSCCLKCESEIRAVQQPTPPPHNVRHVIQITLPNRIR